MAEQGIHPEFQQRLGRALGPEYDVVGLLGRGGFADVFEIRERRLDRSLAIKVLRPEVAWGPWMVARFEREARALASLNHLNIPPIHFVGDNEGLVYYVMPLIAGQSLGDRLATCGPLTPGEVVDVMIPVLDALHHAHHLGILHRDIKPDNIIIEDETRRPLVVDFGVAKQLGVGSPGSGPPDGVIGTPGYISPEQAAGRQEGTAQSDVYSAGATMYHLLTGTLAGGNREPHQVNPAVPPWLSAVVMRALSADRKQRFQTAAEMAESLRIGRRSGGVAILTTAPEVEQIGDDDPTPRMVKVEAAPAVLSGRRRPERRRIHQSPTWWLLFLPVLGTMAAYFLVVPVRLNLRNNLLVPVELSVNGGEARTITPGERISIPLSQQGRFMGRWFVVQPDRGVSREGPGETVSDVIRIEGLTAAELLRRRVNRSIDSWAEGGVTFAPRVHNRSAHPVRVQIVRASGTTLCNCEVAPGETRLIGYFRLESGSAVRLRGTGGPSAVFQNFESRIDLNSGLLELNVTDTTFSRLPQ
jgi:predicted Ser/Thr protein kinase